MPPQLIPAHDHRMMLPTRRLTLIYDRGSAGAPVAVTEQQQSAKTAWPGAEPRRLLITVAAGLIIWAIPVPQGLEPRAWHLLALFVATVVGIIARPLPMGAVALIGISLTVLTGTLEMEQVLEGFSNDTVWLVVCAFLLAGAFIRTGLGARVAYFFMSIFGHRTLGLSYSLAATELVLAPFIPSHAARSGGAVFPILRSLTRSSFGPVDNPAVRKTAGFLTISTYQASCVACAIFLTAMAGNPLAAEFAGQQGISITWGLWLRASFVPGLINLIAVPLVVYALHRPDIRHTPEARTMARKELAALGPMGRNEWILSVVFMLLIVTWAFAGTLGIETAAAALGAIAVLLLTGVLVWEHVAREHEAWTTFVWFAALLMMATELGRLGVPRWFGGVVRGGIGDVNWVVGFTLLVLAYFYSHYFFASNTAHISAMYAAFLAIALVIGAPPVFAALTLAFSSNLFAGLTHYGATAAPVFFSAGYVSIGTWWKVGFLLSLVNISIWLVIGGAWWKVLGLW
jgi:DASS family divalent anion:Na+ symporter